MEDKLSEAYSLAVRCVESAKTDDQKITAWKVVYLLKENYGHLSTQIEDLYRTSWINARDHHNDLNIMDDYEERFFGKKITLN